MADMLTYSTLKVLRKAEWQEWVSSRSMLEPRYEGAHVHVSHHTMRHTLVISFWCMKDSNHLRSCGSGHVRWLGADSTSTTGDLVTEVARSMQ